MKVTNSSTGPNIQNIGTAKEKSTDGIEKGRDRAGVSELSDSVRVNVSDRAQAFQKAKEIAGRQTVDEARVAKLQQLIDEGKYKTDSAAIADRLVDEHLNFPD
jgi:flagellar biosynthesis anti-sigma factor FlgM